MTGNSELPLFCDASAYRTTYVLWNTTRSPHLLVVGATGSGKTYGAMLILGRIVNHVPEAKITLCDYKHDDFKFLDGAKGYYHFDGCTEGLNVFFQEFQKRQEGTDSSRDFRMLVFDEWASYISMLDKKAAENAKQKLSTLLMLGRSFHCHVLVSQQRADAAYFSTARDNFNVVIALGNLSKESRDMFFSGFKEEMKPVRNLGEGYMLVNGAQLHHIQVPMVANRKKLERAIFRLVT